MEVEQWSDNRALSILGDQSPPGACILYVTIGPAMIYTSWMCVNYVCKLKDYIVLKEIEERLYEHYSQANYGKSKHRPRRQKPEEYPQVKNDRSLKQYMKAALRGPAGNL